MARSVKEVIEILSTLDPNASCVWQLWTKDHLGEDLTDAEWESVVRYMDDKPITSEEVGLDELINDVKAKRLGLWE